MIYTILLVIFLILFIILSYKKTDWAVFLTIFLLPSYLIRFSLGPIPMTLLEGMIIIIFLIWLIKNISKIKKVKSYLLDNRWLSISIFLFLLSATISIFISPNFRAALGLWKAYFIEPLFFLAVIVNTIKKEKIKTLILPLTISTLLLSIFAIYQKLTGCLIQNPFWAAESTRRVTSIFPYPNALALYLAPITALLIGYWLKLKKSLITYIYPLAIILNLLAIYFTKSKGAIIGILATILFYAFTYRGHRKIFLTLSLIIILASLFLLSTNQINPNTLKGTPTVVGGDSISTRLDMWKETIEMLKDKPILGAGLAGYQASVAPYHTKDYIEIYLYPHNIFLNFWTEIGLLGLISFILLIIWFFKQLNINDYLKISTAAAMVALLVHGLVDVPYFKNDLSVLFWLIISIIIISGARENGQEVI